MEIKSGYFYFLDNKFFQDVNEPFLKTNKVATDRPHYCAFQDNKFSQIYWLVPSSKQLDKYQKIIDKKLLNNKPCDGLKIINYFGMTSTLLFQDMFPVHESYIKGQYIVKNQEVNIKNPNFKKVLTSQAHKVKNMLLKGVKFTKTQPNVTKIYSLMQIKCSPAPKKNLNPIQEFCENYNKNDLSKDNDFDLSK